MFCGKCGSKNDECNRYCCACGSELSQVEKNINGEFVIVAGELKKYIGMSKDIIIPDGVCAIGWKAFDGLISLQTVVIPDSVEIIYDNSFSYCKKLKKVTIPDSVKEIGRNSFAQCESLTEVKISRNIKTIPAYAFHGCSSLEKVTIPDSVKEIGSTAFGECSSLKDIKLPVGLKKINSWAFEHCKMLESIVIPDNIEEIEMGTFEGCESLHSVTLPRSLKKIQERAFKDCKEIKHLYIPDGVKSLCSGFKHNKLQQVTIPDSMELCLGDFEGCQDLKRINVSREKLCELIDIVSRGGWYRVDYMFSYIFKNSGYVKQIEEIVNERMHENVCVFCGGKFKMFKKICSNCGKEKNY